LKICRGVGACSGRWGTIGYLVTRDGVLVIDSQVPNAAPACLDGLKPKSRMPSISCSTRIITAITPPATRPFARS
jgi:hypothetical protein